MYVSPKIKTDILAKHDYPSFMYAEYPHKSFWADRPNERDYKAAMKRMFAAKADEPLLLYIHIPYCEQQCLFCCCRTIITRDYSQTTSYIQQLCAEIDLYREFFETNSIRPNFTEIHIGGGTPSAVSEADFDVLMAKLGSIVNLKTVNEFTIEIDPRGFKKDKLNYYHKHGVNRLSFGVQEFDSGVQKAVNRVQPAELLANLLESKERKLFNSVSFDLLMGLPRQTPESFNETMENTLKLGPDRVVMIYFMYSPAHSPHMYALDRAELPDTNMKAKFYFNAREKFLNNGYVAVGADAYVKPRDPLAESVKKKTLEWNCLGYTAGRYKNILGLGISSSLRVADTGYFQNAHSLPDWGESVKKRHFPIARSYEMNEDDIVRRDVIYSLRNYLSVDPREIEAKHKIRFDEYFQAEKAALEGFVKDGIVELSNGTIKITDFGMCLTDKVCRIFDNCHTEKRHFAVAPKR